ncbi:hypothetical protein HanXRQr2_Chr12g0523931 [Helianthus annuus]|uniref:Uncharacterized protein n=1 Tax=Helianthus annuus TaxID=4232 RepID=A0A9K3ENS1_HELAN|nr:hypothetical protein HanXRQr2_Chr12g0523931 [Helianthus annuus]
MLGLGVKLATLARLILFSGLALAFANQLRYLLDNIGFYSRITSPWTPSLPGHEIRADCLQAADCTLCQ